MHKLLIVCDSFPPAFAPRMGYLVKYLNGFGWDADILCEDNAKDNNFSSLLGKNKVYRVKIDKNEVPKGFIAKMWRFYNLNRRFTNNKYPFIITAKSKLRRNDYRSILVSCSWNLYVLHAGYEIARLFGVPIIADLRDLHEQRSLNELESTSLKTFFFDIINRSRNKKVLSQRNNILRKVNSIVTVSPWHCKVLSNLNSSVNLIYNGYDSELFYPNVISNHNFFNIVYTGVIIDKKNQDPSILFKAIRLLKEKNQLGLEGSFRIQFYTPERCRHFITEIGDYKHVKGYVDFFNYMESSDVPKVLNASCIALVLSNLSGDKGPKGVLTTKFFEYLGAERPILCVKSDEDVIEEAIKNANAGVAARSVEEAYDFILDKLNEWKEKGFTSVSVNQKYKKQFSRELQAGQFVDVFEKVINSQE